MTIAKTIRRTAEAALTTSVFRVPEAIDVYPGPSPRLLASFNSAAEGCSMKLGLSSSGRLVSVRGGAVVRILGAEGCSMGADDSRLE